MFAFRLNIQLSIYFELPCFQFRLVFAEDFSALQTCALMLLLMALIPLVPLPLVSIDGRRSQSGRTTHLIGNSARNLSIKLFQSCFQWQPLVQTLEFKALELNESRRVRVDIFSSVDNSDDSPNDLVDTISLVVLG